MLAIDNVSGLGFRDNLANIKESDLPQPNNSRILLRPEDASRIGRPFRFDDNDRPPRAASEDTRLQAQRADALQTLDESPVKPEEDKPVAQSTKNELSLLSLEDTTDLFKRKVADARQDTEHALAGSEAVRDVVKPKLTLDLGHSNIARLPESVVDLIKDEVERLSLSHNQIWHIPLRFSECSHLRYLNIRSNVFREIPRGVYKLHQLEILDISRNKVRKISSDIKNLKSLKVFSVVHNRVEELPTELCEMTKLQILKIAENPLRFRLKRVVEAKESEVSFSEMTDHERETAITLEIKRYLREAHPSTLVPIDVEASLRIDESPMETPKPLKRTLSSRFPVIPSTGFVESASEGNKSSPLQPYPPPVPTRSHYRMASGTQSIAMRRPGIAPLISQTSNERNRSNSESVLQASAAARHKRMGMLRREKPDLDSIDELKVNRNSHLRGFSHGSVLKRNGALSSPGGASSSSPNSPRDPRRHRLAFVKRLSSLPEHKVETEWKNPVIEGAKGILYALYQIHPQISGLIAAIRGKDVRRSTLEFTFFNASTHVDRLNEALEQADAVDIEDEDAIQMIEATVRRDCATCIMAYTHVTAQLQDNVKKIVAGTDPRYVRSLMLLLYGSMLEVRNAIQSFGADVNVTQRFGHRRQLSSGNTHPIQTIPEEFSTPSQPVRAVTPTRDRNLPSRQGGRLRSDTAIQHPVAENIPAYHPNSVLHANSASLPTPIHLTGTTLDNGALTSTSSTFSSSGTLMSNGFRSRSSSRAAMMNGLPSSVASTPRSGEVFNLPIPNSYAARVNPATGLTDGQEEAAFEQIFLALSRAYDAALHTIPIAKAQFLGCLEAAEENRQPRSVHDLWSTLVYRCKLCIDVSEALQIRLVNMRLTEPSAPGTGRNDPSLWSLCKNFLMSFIELLTDMREAKSLRLLSQELIIMLRPVQKASREAGRLIETSPWRYLTDSATAAMPPPSVFNTMTSQRSGPTMNGSGYANVHVNGTGVNGNASAYQTVTSSLGQHPVQSPFPPPLIPVPPVPGSGPSSAYTYTPNTATMHPKQMFNVNVNGYAGANGVNGAGINGISPVSVPLPATPLSAALGPAAQATVPNMDMHMSMQVPSTPASAYGDQFFKGDVFQRADSLLSMPQAGSVNFLNRRER
ncbi:RAM signaling network component [Exophiala xenobiotica]|uniref:RAM signaling network component n=1 Tax=Vermiconidia calcicola TaxID=1690605 RepID=A0AAV9Q5Q8_9PEZI|nr:RAM signaling network component [Exophiala xenobiotica]KAK5533836.1 RAM signaling network component [Vermiconidia calcicola]KAK5546387.1 RAM signaling network component [Chaetothyriales sp. CCFEE 6169]KAK5291772.1 RAM signaling network component [Exophiala xenobiotica]KAK5342046.1 RAM signaling network component [Exophiala xenobiotica]